MQTFNTTLQEVANEFLGMKTFFQQNSSGMETQMGEVRGEVGGIEGRVMGHLNRLEQVQTKFIQHEKGKENKLGRDLATLENRIIQLESNLQELSNKVLVTDGLVKGEPTNIRPVMQLLSALEIKQGAL